MRSFRPSFFYKSRRKIARAPSYNSKKMPLIKIAAIQMGAM